MNGNMESEQNSRTLLYVIDDMNENVAEMALQEVESLVMGRHYIAAREKLVQMKNLYPYALDRIGSMLTLCDVLSANSSHFRCGVDYYWVLNASPLNNLYSITTSYNHILNSLSQLKTESPASQLALELVEKAFSAISDKRKRLSFYYETRSGSGCHLQDYFDFDSERWSDCIVEGQTWAVDFHTSLMHGYKYGRVSFVSEEAVRVTRLRPIPVSGCERNLCESGFPVSCGKFELGPDTESDMSWPVAPSYRCDLVRSVLDNQFEIYPRRGEVWAVYKDWNIEEWAYCGFDKVKQCRFELVEIKSEFSKYTGVDCAYLEKVDGFRCVFQRKTFQVLHVRPGMFYMFSHKVPAYRFAGGEISGAVDGMFELDWAALPDHILSDTTEVAEKTECSTKEFKPCCSTGDCRAGQIWTVCSEKDQMPRQYARIDHIISEFQVCVTFLKPLVERENLPIVSGLFTVGSTSVNKDVSQLSYKVRCQRRNDTFYEIHPMKGEVWAMYKKLNNEWKQFDYEVVLILSDTSEGDGTKIARLEKVNGYLTFFQKQQCGGFDLTGMVTETLSFSHRIPSFRVPGIERHGIHKGVWHLEPSALPRNQGVRV